MIFAEDKPAAVDGPALAASEDEKDSLNYIRDASNKDDPYLYAMRGSMYTSILFTHGLQNYAYSLSQGRAIDVRDEGDESSSVVFNIILPTIESQIALLLTRTPERQVVATTRDDRDIEAAHYATDLLKWADEYHDLPHIYEQAANWFAKTGNVFLFVGWDPTGGRFFMDQQGQPVFEGDPIIRVDSAFAWTLHPQANSYKDSPYAHHSCMVHRSWLEEHYPEIMRELPEDERNAYAHEGGLLFENLLKNLGPSHGYFGTWGIGHTNALDGHPKGESYFEIQTLYVRSCPKYPSGRMMIALARNGTAFKILYDGENPYIDWRTGRRTLPIVHMANLQVPGRALGESFVTHMIPMQQVVNRHRSQILDNAALNGNPRMYLPEDGVDESQLTDDVGSIVRVPIGAEKPGYMAAPELPSYIVECEKAALQFMEILTRPFGPLRSEQENISSGIHQMIVAEQKMQLVAPIITRWENGWDAAWKLYIDNWRTFASLPRKVSVPGDDGGWRETYFSGSVARANFVVSVKPGSSMPTSRAATFAEWVELIKSGAAPIQMDPALARQFWKDLGRPEIARTFRDNTVHMDKARRNIQRVRSGEVRQAELQDNLEVHLTVYSNWMCTPEYEAEVARDPMFGMRMVAMFQSFQMMLQQQMMMAQMAAGGEVAEGNEQADRVQKANQKQPGEAGGDGGFPRQTQGFGKARPSQSPPRPEARAGETDSIG